jgi:hypothetical protein
MNTIKGNAELYQCRRRVAVSICGPMLARNWPTPRGKGVGLITAQTACYDILKRTLREEGDMSLRNLLFGESKELPSCPSCGATAAGLWPGTYVAKCENCGCRSCGRCGQAPGLNSPFKTDTWGMNGATCPECGSIKLLRIGVLNGT